MPKPVCIPCQRFFRPKQNGYVLTEMMPKGSDRALPGTLTPDRWMPYKVWRCDLWECEGCGAQIATGFGFDPLAIHHEKGFEEVKALSQSIVNDC